MRISLSELIDDPDVVDEADVILGVNRDSNDPVVFFGSELLTETASSRSTCCVLEIETKGKSDCEQLARLVKAHKGYHEYHE